MTRHITGTRVPTVTRQVMDIARGGDFRAIRITLLGQPGVLHDRPGIVTPHRDARGELDAADLAAQVWAIAFDLWPDNGTCAGGIFNAGGIGHSVPDPTFDPEEE